MDIDPDIANWVLEFLLRQPLEDRTLSSLLRSLPLPNNNPNLQKPLLLKKLESEVARRSFSETTLELLEQLEEIEFRRGNGSVSEAMKRAYCAVAVDCTVKVSKSGGAGGGGDKGCKFVFFEAVKRVWRGRIGRMKEAAEKGGLGSEFLWVWKDEIEAAVWDDAVCESVVKKSEEVDAVGAVNAYLKEEREKMGPSFLELVAERVKSDGVLQGILGVDGVDQVAGKDAHASGVDRVADGSTASKEMHGRKIKLRDKLVGLKRSRGFSTGNSRGAKIVDSDETIVGPSCRKYRSPSSAEVNKVREALESSSLELQAVVKDPLPDALKLAEAVADEARKNRRQEPEEDNHIKATTFIVDNAGIVQATRAEDNHAKATPFIVDNAGVAQAAGTGVAQDAGGNKSNGPRPSLMERNCSARTYEWDDSIDGSQDDPAHRGMLQLPSPRRLNTSPLDRYEIKNLKKRRKGRRWSLLEEDTLRAGVEKYGKGNWKVILTVYRDIFEGRTEVDLKDKWRNLTRY